MKNTPFLSAILTVCCAAPALAQSGIVRDGVTGKLTASGFAPVDCTDPEARNQET